MQADLLVASDVALPGEIAVVGKVDLTEAALHVRQTADGVVDERVEQARRLLHGLEPATTVVGSRPMQRRRTVVKGIQERNQRHRRKWKRR